MKIAADVAMAIATAMMWLGAIAFLRLRTPLDRLHVVTFVNVATLGSLVIAAFLNDGVTSRSLKCAFIWLFAVGGGALLSHATARALHLRTGEWR